MDFAMRNKNNYNFSKDIVSSFKVPAQKPQCWISIPWSHRNKRWGWYISWHDSAPW